jgi:hypothetical protein
MRAAVAVLGLAGCNLVFDATSSTTPDGAVGGDGDGAISTACDRGAPFGNAVGIDAQGRSVEAARFTRDESFAYLSTCPVEGNGGVNKAACDLFVSPYQRGEPLSAFPMAGVNAAKCYDAYPTITADGKHIMYASTRSQDDVSSCADLKIWVATSADGTFATPMMDLFTGVPSSQCGNEPYVVGDDGQALYFSTVPCMGGRSDLRVARGAPPTYDQSSMVITELSLAGQDEFAPVVTEDELEIFFARGASPAKLDIFHASRATTVAPFSNITKLPALSSEGIDWPVWISPDACRLYFIQKAADDQRATLFMTSREQ